MNTDAYVSSSYHDQFQAGLKNITQALPKADQFHINLYFSSVVTMMEKYLYDVYIDEIESNDDAFYKMSLTDKFKNTTYPLAQILKGDVKKFVINSVKNLVWHRLNDIDFLYRNTLSIKFNNPQELRAIIISRHDIIHRNGFNLEGGSTNIDSQDVSNAITVVSAFIFDIDKKYHTYKSNSAAA